MVDLHQHALRLLLLFRHSRDDDRQTDTTPRKAGHPSRISIATTKKCNCSQGETALCCAVLALSGTDTLVSLIPRPVPGHQRLDDRRSPLGASHMEGGVHIEGDAAEERRSKVFWEIWA